RLAKVVDVVERIVKTEDVDAALRGGRDEPAGEVPAHRPGADEEPATEGEGRRRARLQRPDPLPRALDPTSDGVVEDASARHLEVREPRSVQELGEPKQLGGRHEAGQRLLAQDADRRVDQARHGTGRYPAPDGEPDRVGPVRGVQARVRASCARRGNGLPALRRRELDLDADRSRAAGRVAVRDAAELDASSQGKPTPRRKSVWPMTTMSPELALVDPELRADAVARLPPIYVNSFLESRALPVERV